MNIFRRLKLWWLEQCRDSYFNEWLDTQSQIALDMYYECSDKAYKYAILHNMDGYR